MPIVDKTDEGYWCVTWGGLKLLTPAFLDKYCDEMYACISNDFLTDGKAPNGFDVGMLTEDLAKVEC